MSTELRNIDHSYHDAWLGSKSKLGYSQWLADRAEAAEARAAQLQAERDALAAQLATVTKERDALKQIGRDFQVALYERKGMAPLTHREEYAIMNLNKIIGRVISHIERWSFQSDETPLGQALDGLGDEVEP